MKYIQIIHIVCLYRHENNLKKKKNHSKTVFAITCKHMETNRLDFVVNDIRSILIYI